MKRLIVVMVALAFCLPARAEILIFCTSTSGQQLNVESKIVESKSERGYLVINADLADTDSVTVSEAYHLHYEKKDGGKIQYTTILSTEDVELILVNYGSKKKMVLRWFDDYTGTYTAVYGTAAMKDIGGLQRYAASSVSGYSVWKQQDFRTGSGKITLRLDIRATKLANTAGSTVENIVEGYSQMLETKGYSSE